MWVLVCVLLSIIAAPTKGDISVTLTSNLRDGVAYDQQRVIFNCVTRGSGVHDWSSNEYIDQHGIPMQILSLDQAQESVKPTIPSNSNHDTVGKRVNLTDDNGVIVIESELRITVSMQFPNATVTCGVNGGGTAKEITFSTIAYHHDGCLPLTTIVIHPESIPATTLPDNSTPNGMKKPNGQACQIGLISYSVITTFIIAILTGIIIKFICHKYCKNSENTSPPGKFKDAECITDLITKMGNKRKRENGKKKKKGANGPTNDV